MSAARIHPGDAAKPRKRCEGPWCHNTVPLHWHYCTDHDCGNARLWASLTGDIEQGWAAYWDILDRHQTRSLDSLWDKCVRDSARKRAAIEREAEATERREARSARRRERQQARDTARLAREARRAARESDRLAQQLARRQATDRRHLRVTPSAPPVPPFRPPVPPALERAEAVWERHAGDADHACAIGPAGVMTEVFFSEERACIDFAKTVCAECRIKDDCLDDALTRKEPWGVWGGQLLVGGKPERRRGRPPRSRVAA